VFGRLCTFGRQLVSVGHFGVLFSLFDLEEEKKLGGKIDYTVEMTYFVLDEQNGLYAR